MNLLKLKARIHHFCSDHNIPVQRKKNMLKALDEIFGKYNVTEPDDLVTVFEPFVKEPFDEDDLMGMAHTMVEAWILLIEFEEFDPG